MDTDGLWRLFFATGLPQVYLALRGAQAPAEPATEPVAKTAFSAEKSKAQPV